MARRVAAFAVAMIVVACGPGRSEPWVIKRGLVRVHAGAGPYTPVVDHVKRQTKIEVVGKDAGGRWLKATGIWVNEAGEEKVVPFKAGPDGAPVAEGWVPKLAARSLSSATETVVVARMTPKDVSVMRTNVMSALRGYKAGMDSMIQNQKLDAQIAAWIAKPKFSAEEHGAFAQATGADVHGREIEIQGEEDALLDVDPEVHDEAGRVSATEMAQELGARVVTDPALNRYVNLVAAVIGQCSSRYDLLYRVIIVDDAAVNSYARPGGYVAVTTGLLALCEDEAELAGVLAHEIAHIGRDHGLKERRNLAKELGIDIAGIEDDLNAQVMKHFGDDSSEFQTAAVRDLAQMASFLRGVAFSKKRLAEEEQEADFYALVYLARCGYYAAGLRRLVDRLGRKYGYDQDTTMAVHDAPRIRLQYIDAYMGHLALRPAPQRTLRPRFSDEMSRLQRASRDAVKPAKPDHVLTPSKKEPTAKPKGGDPFAELDRIFGEL